VTVAVVDTGVDRGNADLAPNLLPGRNTYDGNDDTSDGAGHGTVIASVIGAPAGNGGYVGIAPDSKLLPVKVMGGSFGRDWSDGAVVRGIEFALAEGAKVINLSIGGLNAPIAGIEKPLADAQRAGALVVIAAEGVGDVKNQLAVGSNECGPCIITRGRLEMTEQVSQLVRDR